MVELKDKEFRLQCIETPDGNIWATGDSRLIIEDNISIYVSDFPVYKNEVKLKDLIYTQMWKSTIASTHVELIKAEI